MIWIIVIAALILLAFFPTMRCAILNVIPTVMYAVADAIRFVGCKQYNDCHTGELLAYVGLFGKGKTLSVVKRVVSDFKKYNDKRVWCDERRRFVKQKVKILSNVHLQIPYEKLVSLEQIVICAAKNRTADDENETKTITLVLGDEFSVQMNSRNFKTNIDPLFLNTILTCRHYHISLFYTTQRFQHVDALLRQVTAFVINCDKLWRFQRLYKYNAWEMENATNPLLLQPVRRACWFVHNRDFKAYDTYATVGNLTKSMKEGDMMTAEEILALQCNTPANMDAVAKPSKKWMRTQKKMKK